MVRDEIKKLTCRINTIILIMVFILMAFFAWAKAEFLVWYSIPTAAVYIIGYFLIFKEKLSAYVRMVYTWLTIYMSITTICLGYRFGFHLYSMSMIPIIFYTEYMSYKMNVKKLGTTFFSILVILTYLITTGYSAYYPPIYDVDTKIAGVFLLFNSVVVLGFVTFYSRLLIRMIIASDKELSERANKDRLTHLYNRHYMMEKLKAAYKDEENHYIAMIDIDNFKSINDKYGHLAGDEVLKRVAGSMVEVCTGCEVSRWGGEEFLILTDEGTAPIEKLRKAVEDMVVDFEDQTIRVTLTAGVEKKDKAIAFNKWIVAADEKLYIGKNSGKNRVVA